MSDRPNDPKPDEPEKSTAAPPADSPSGGGWRTPEQKNAPAAPSNWRAAGQEAAPQAPPQTWRVPTLPRDLKSDKTGAWHLPNPTDTKYSPDDEIVIPVATESPAPAATPATAEPTPVIPEPSSAAAPAIPVPTPATDTPIPPTDATPAATPAASTTPPVTEADTAAVQDVLPFDGAQTTDLQAAAPAATPLEPLEEEDDDSFSMSELVALASLVDNVPSVQVQPAPAASASNVQTGTIPPVEPSSSQQVAGTAENDAPIDPGEYARRQLALLQASRGNSAQAPAADASVSTTGASSATPAEPAQAGVVSPEEYARQQLQRLGVEPSSGASQPAPAASQPAAPAPSVSDSQQALAAKFRSAEESIRALRQQYQQGQITRDTFQADLKNLMVLDDNNVWWMMGVESDRWYRHDNGQWVPATPPALDAALVSGSAIQPVPTDMGDEGDRTVPTSPITNQWIPRQVPVRDPDYTVPGTGGIFLDSALTADTIPMARTDVEATVPSSAISGATVPNAAIQQSQYESVGSPIAEQAPTYEVAAPSPDYAKVVADQRRSTARTIAIIAAIIAALIFLLGAVGAIGVVLYYNSLADPYRGAIAGLANYQPQFRTARILAADGSLIAELTSPQGGARDEVGLDKISPEMVDAVVSVENERYFQDPGWDPIAIVRAFLQNLTAGGVVSGASTITQEVARNLVMQDNTVSPARKLQEIVVAAEIARQYDKNFILQLYLNEVFFGNQSYGVEAASQFYFKHSAADLNLPEAAMLAGLIQAPATYDPVINRQAAFDRMEVVLGRMATVGCLQFSFTPYDKQPFCVTQADVTSPKVVLQKAKVETATYVPRTFTVKYPHFVNYVQQQIENTYGTSAMFQRGFEIKTTLIPRIQDTAQSALEQQVKALASNGVNTGAVMVTDPRDGSIRAMIGSPDFSDNTIDGQVNNAFTWQQPGSSIKIVEYTGALEGTTVNGATQYLTPASILWDVPTTFSNPNYSPVNYDGTFHGPVALRYAFANSYNVPAVKTLNFIGLDKFLDVAQRIGLRFLPDATFSLPTALGANEVRLYDMMQAYGTLANNGTRVPLFSITDIKDASGNELALPDRPQSALAVQPQIAFLIQNILSDNTARTPAFGANSALNVNGYNGLVAAKTGTSNDNRDLWTMGFSSNAVVGVWVGRVDNAPTNNTSGLAAAPIWNAVITAALQGTNPQPFNPPAGIVQQQVCADTGTIYDSTTGCTNVRTEYFVQSEPPPPASQGFVMAVPVDTWTSLKANQFCPDSVVTKNFVNINDPSAIAWLQTPAGAAYAQSIGLPNPPSPAPTAECTTNTVLPQVHFTAPTNGQQLTGTIQFTGVASGPNFARYQIELAPSSAPTNFQPVAGPFNSQQNGNLATWDSTTVPNGAYLLRLSAFATDGGYRYDTINIGVNNIIPTQPPPTLPPIVVPTDINGATPIPAQSVGGPTPTIFQGP